MGLGSAQSEEATLPGTQEAMWGVKQMGATVPAGAATQLLASGGGEPPGEGSRGPSPQDTALNPGRSPPSSSA